MWKKWIENVILIKNIVRITLICNKKSGGNSNYMWKWTKSTKKGFHSKEGGQLQKILKNAYFWKDNKDDKNYKCKISSYRAADWNTEKTEQNYNFSLRKNCVLKRTKFIPELALGTCISVHPCLPVNL